MSIARVQSREIDPLFQEQGVTDDELADALAALDGSTLFSGAGAPPEDAGETGDFYLRTSNYTLVGPKLADNTWAGATSTALVGAQGPQGEDGPQGETGAQGPPGEAGDDGADGLSIRSGAGAPTGAVGVDGEFYVRTSDWTIYGPKTGGAWGSATSLIGPQGPAGADGADGADGAQGPPGEDGADGAPGAPGAPGADGDSAYEVAVANGFVGTEAEWLDSLVGPEGPEGPQGPEGDPGAQGEPGVPGEGSGAIVSNAAGQSIPDDTWTAVSFEVEDSDPDAMHDGTNPTRLTPGAAGRYAIAATVTFDAVAGGGPRMIELRKNGTTTIASETSPVSLTTHDHAMTIAAIAILDEDDYVEVRVRQIAGGAIDLLNASFEIATASGGTFDPGAAIDYSQLKGVVVHGATAGTARPTEGFDSVEWIGSVEPTNAIDNDTWIQTA